MTNACTSTATSHPDTYVLLVLFWHGLLPTLMDDVREPVGGLLTDVPKGWLFHVIPASVHELVTLKTSSVRHAEGSVDTYRRSVTVLIEALAGIAGVHFVRSNRM